MSQVEVSILGWNWAKNSQNPVCCGRRMYKMSISLHRYGRVNVGFYCYKCGCMLGNGPLKLKEKLKR